MPTFGGGDKRLAGKFDGLAVVKFNSVAVADAVIGHGKHFVNDSPPGVVDAINRSPWLQLFDRDIALRRGNQRTNFDTLVNVKFVRAHAAHA